MNARVATWADVRAFVHAYAPEYAPEARAQARQDAATPVLFEDRRGPQGAAVMGLTGGALEVLALVGASRAGLIPAALAWAEQAARDHGAACVVFYTRRPGLRRVMARRGFHEAPAGGGKTYHWKDLR